MEGIPAIMTRSDVQKILKVSKGTVLKLIQSGELEAFRLGNSYRVTREALMNYIEYAQWK